LRADPRLPDALARAYFGPFSVTRDDCVFGDGDGVIFIEMAGMEEVLRTARAIHATERRQSEAMSKGISLREQLQFDRFLAERDAGPGLTFREYLRRIGGAIEE
jgi:hypothetical protein